MKKIILIVTVLSGMFISCFGLQAQKSSSLVCTLQGGGYGFSDGPKYSYGASLYGIKNIDVIGLGAGVGLEKVNSLRYSVTGLFNDGILGEDVIEYCDDIIVPVFVRCQINLPWWRMFLASDVGYGFNVKAQPIKKQVTVYPIDDSECKTEGLFVEPAIGFYPLQRLYVSLGYRIRRT